MESYTYLLVNLACVSIPLIASFYPKHAFYKKWFAFIKASLIVAIIFLVWDYWFTKIGVWGFNEYYLTGIYLLNLPLEEVLFFICIPYCCVFTYFTFQYLFKKNLFDKTFPIINYSLIIVLFIAAVLNYNKLYTSITFFSTSAYLSYLAFRKINLSYYYLSYLCILPFFLLSNGILTGSFLVDPIVWYNDTENLGIRLFNIPIEDSIYGLLLIFMNIQLFDYFNSKA